VGAFLDAITGVLDTFPDAYMAEHGATEEVAGLMRQLCENLLTMTAAGKEEMMEKWQPV
jgi:hypothetical protein